jgi:hypothetical protein
VPHVIEVHARRQSTRKAAPEGRPKLSRPGPREGPKARDVVGLADLVEDASGCDGRPSASSSHRSPKHRAPPDRPSRRLKLDERAQRRTHFTQPQGKVIGTDRQIGRIGCDCRSNQ